jgi:carotenoid cleavage dioxygenase-like enzyme
MIDNNLEIFINPYLQGNHAPVTEEVDVRQLRVTGRIPPELRGRYVRNGANALQPIDPLRHHEFIGEGMVHGVRLADGRAEWYRNRWVRGASVRERFGEPDCGGPVHLSDFSANTHVIGFAGRTLALVESGFLPYELDFELNTVSRHDFHGTLPNGFAAHAKVDPGTG